MKIVGIIACVIVAAVIIFTTFFGDINIDINIRTNDKQRNK